MLFYLNIINIYVYIFGGKFLIFIFNNGGDPVINQIEINIISLLKLTYYQRMYDKHANTIFS